MKRINKTSQAGWKSGLSISGGPDDDESTWKDALRRYRTSDNIIDRRGVSEIEYMNSVFDRNSVPKDQSRIPPNSPDFPTGDQKTGGDPYLGGEDDESSTRKVDALEAVRRTHTNRK